MGSRSSADPFPLRVAAGFVEIFKDTSVLDRQPEQPEVAAARTALIPSLAAPLESTTCEVESPPKVGREGEAAERSWWG